MKDWLLWAGLGLGLYFLVKSKKAPAYEIVKTPWKHEGCQPVSATVLPYVNKLKRAAEAAFGPAVTGEVCVEVNTLPGLTEKERTNITLQMLVPGIEDVTLDVDTIESRTQDELRDELIGLQSQ